MFNQSLTEAKQYLMGEEMRDVCTALFIDYQQACLTNNSSDSPLNYNRTPTHFLIFSWPTVSVFMASIIF